MKTFQDQVEEKEKAIGQTGRTATVTFQITDDCNLQCTYCYQINKGHHVMPYKYATKFIDMIISNQLIDFIDYNEYKGLIIEFIGGEPFLQVELMDHILDYFLNKIKNNTTWIKYWRVCITSNGTLYFNENVQKFLKKWNKVLSLSISIDGNKQLHDTCRKFPNGKGSYDLAIKAVLHYKKYYNGWMSTKMTLAPENIQYASDAYINLIKLGYIDINSNCVYEKGWTIEHAKIFYEELKKTANYLLSIDTQNIYLEMFRNFMFNPLPKEVNTNWCGSVSAMIALDWKGDIYPCTRFMESSLGNEREPIIIGNIFEGILTTDKCKNCIKQLHAITRISQSTEECITCPIANGCSWCTAYNYQETGDFNKRVTNICCMHKARALANCYFWNLYYRKNNENNRFKLWLSDEECLKIIDKDELAILRALEK